MTSYVRAQRRVACPFSIAPEYAVHFLQQFKTPLGGVVEVPLAIFGIPLPVALKHHVRLRFAVHGDTTEVGRQHDALRISWWSESPWLPNLSGALRFRIASDRETLLLFEGSYEPPFGLTGAIFDGLVGRHFAAATAWDLLVRLGAALEAEERAFRSAHMDTQ